MKTSAIIRIVAWTLVACALVAVLVTTLALGGVQRIGGLFFQGLSSNFGGFGGAYSAADDSLYTVGGAEIPVGDIRNVSVDWVSGSVSVTASDRSGISFSESSALELSEGQTMRYRVDGDTLYIRFCASGFLLNWNTGSKALALSLPKDMNLDTLRLDVTSAKVEAAGLALRDLRIDSTSGDVRLSGVSADAANLDSVSGRLFAEECAIRSIDAETVSGEIRCIGTFDECEMETVSGAQILESAACPRRLSAESISGAIVVRFPESGFTAEYSSVSGGFTCDFAVTQKKGRVVCGDGAASMSLSTVSGDIRLQKLS